ncbi:MAG: acylphosphatase [Acidimicrobiia bacterium]|nr:acylphosphatase [Acidimicrobiia bacterium]
MTDDARHPALYNTTAINVIVTGRVQGVGFRYSTENAARRLGVVGWVRNRRDGSVETWAQGPDDAVAQFAAFLEEGPRSAHVTSLDVAEVEPDLTLHRFEVRF